MKRFDAQACIKRLGLEDGGSVQKAVDQSILDVCEPYTPMDLSSGADGGGLVRSAIMHTVIGSGEIVWRTPYAHYVYEGKVYVDPITPCSRIHDGRRLALPKERVQNPYRQESELSGSP